MSEPHDPAPGWVLEAKESARRALGKYSPQMVWSQIVDKVLLALDEDPENSQRLAEEMRLFNQPDDPLELHDLQDRASVAAQITAASRTPPWLPSDGDIGVGVFPEGKEVLVGSAALGSFARERIGTGEAKTGERAQRKVDDNATVVEELLKIGNSGSLSVMRDELSLATDVDRVECPQ